jgi:DNA-binding MarR family transcriptional regulator
MISLGYEKWGLSADTFNPRPLTAQKEYEELFVKKEERYIDFLLPLGKKNAIFCLEGKFGTGKTTSYNAFSYFARRERESLILERPIEVKDFMNSADVLSQIVERVANVLMGEIETGTKRIGKKAKKKLEDIYYSSTSIGRETQMKGSIKAPIFNIGRAKTKGVTQTTGKSNLFDRSKSDLATLGEIATEEFEVRNICLALDELEYHKIDPEMSNKIIGGLRNAFFTNNYCFCLIGDDGLESRLYTERRFRGALSSGIKMDELLLTEFHEVMQKRYEFYKSKDAYTPPFEEDVPDRLYEISDGDVRWALQSLSRSFDWMVKTDVPRKLGSDDVVGVIYKDIQNKYQLSDPKWRILDVIARFGEISPSDSEVLSELNIERPTLSGHLNKLRKEYVDLIRERTKGRKYLYYLGPDGLVLKESGYIGG